MSRSRTHTLRRGDLHMLKTNCVVATLEPSVREAVARQCISRPQGPEARKL
jgi:hypothetical protein